jgi:HEAT repeat protein
MSDRDDLALPDLSTQEVLERALALSREGTARESDELWSLVAALHRRPEEKVFETASEWCQWGSPSERELGADVLGQLGHTGPSFESPFGSRSLPVLLALLSDSEARVLQSAITALGHLASHHVSWEPEKIRDLAFHLDPDVRHAVAFALGGSQCDSSSVAVAIMLDLMSDADVDVRDWATFGLAISEADSDRIREALLERVQDEDQEVRGEALVGLARRGDERAFPVILSELSGDEVSTLAIEAAAELARPEFIPHLESLLEANPDSADIIEAIRACRDDAPAA